MADLSLALLGSFQAWTENGEQQSLRTLKERALLAYVAVEHTRPHRRDELADLLWPDRSESVARNSLRQALYGLRQAVGGKAFDNFCTVTSRDVQFHLNQHVWLDVAAFDLHWKSVQSHRHAHGESCAYCFQHLYDAAELYRGNFLEDIFIEKAPALQSWIALQRDRCRHQQIQVLDQLSSMFEAMGNIAQAADYAARQAGLDGTNEALHRRWMMLQARLGQGRAALETFDRLLHAVARDKGGTLDHQTRELAEQIRQGQHQAVSIPETRSTLPEQLTQFFGREMELAQLAQTLENPNHRLVSIVGPGGAGKTRFAVHSARMLLHVFPDGVFYIPLENVSSPEHLPETIARGMELAPNQVDETISVLINCLGRQRVLLLLDNFEHLLDGGDFVLSLLRAAPNLKILVTSRERLRLQSETVIELEGLPYLAPTGAQESPPAVRLLLERASRVRMRVVSNGGNSLEHPADQEAAQKVCALVDGLPLGIEMAASWAHIYSLSQIAQEIEKNAEFLRTSLSDVPERHRSLWASFEHSWNLLSETEQEIFSKLAVFPSSFSTQAAQEAAGAAFPWLVSLVEQSLLRRVTFGRYDLHPLLRQYAGQKLHKFSRKAEEATQRQHAQYFCGLIGELEPALKGDRQVEALQSVDVEIENILAAWEWAVDAFLLDSLEAAGPGLFYYLETRSRYQEGLACFLRSTERLRADGELHPQRLLAYSLAAQGWFACRLSRFADAQRCLTDSLTIIGEDISREKTFGHFALGFLQVWMGQFEAAWHNLSISLETAQQRSDRWSMAWARELLTELAVESERMPYTKEPFLENLLAFERIGDQRGIARALNYLGNIAMASEQYQDARNFFQRMLVAVQSIGDVWGAAGGFDKLGQLAIAREDFPSAKEFLQRGLALFQKTGDRRREAYVLGELGETTAALGDLPAAQGFFARALDTALDTRSLSLAQDILTSIAGAEIRAGNTMQAAALLEWVSAFPIADRLTARRAKGLIHQLDGLKDSLAAAREEDRFWQWVALYRAQLNRR